jgi:hypothetical protein
MSGWGDRLTQIFPERIVLGAEEAFEQFRDKIETGIENAVRNLLTEVRPLLGPNEVAEGFSLFPEPVLNVNDPVSETASVVLPDDVYLFSLGLLDIGGRFGPSSELFSKAVNLNFDRDANDDDAEQVLSEIVEGSSGAVFDNERVPGIEGVELISITPESYTLSFDNGEALDVLTLEGPGIERVINKLDSPVALGDGINSLGLVNLSEETVTVSSGSANPVVGIADEPINTEEELAALLDAAVNPDDERVSLLSVKPDSFAVRVDEQTTNVFDLLIFNGDPAERAIATVADLQVDPWNGISELAFADLAGQDVVASGPNLDAFFGGPGLDTVGSTVTEDELLGIFQTADERPRVNAIDQGDTVRLDILGESGSRDVIVFATTEPVPGGALDLALFA